MAYVKMIFRRDMINCMLCKDAPCNNVCDVAVDKLLRNIWFDNERAAAINYPDNNPCLNCDAPCEKNCIVSNEVPIRNLMLRLQEEVKPTLDSDICKMSILANSSSATSNIDKHIDYSSSTASDINRLLKTDICSIPIENPFLLSSSVISSTYDMCARAFEAGWAGAALKTISSLDIHEASPRFSAIKNDNGSFTGFKNIEQLSTQSVEENMDMIRRLKKNYPNKFILASIMGKDDNDWEELSRLCDENGADAIELNFSCPNMMDEGLGSDIGLVPELVKRFTKCARRGTNKPILAKLTPNVTNMGPAAYHAKEGGADGIAAINTIKSIMNIDPYTYVSSPNVNGMSSVGGYSGNAVKPIALRFIDELGSDDCFSAMHISAMGGIETWKDALEFMMLGASSIQVTTAVMQYGYRIIDDLKSGLALYLQECGLDNVTQVVGRSLKYVSETTDIIERDTVTFPIVNREKCNGCGRCELSCMDGGHQAITLNDNRKPVVNGKKCVGCHLCLLVCPINAIRASEKRIHL